MTMNSNENEAKKPNITFELNENESQAARDFMREHKNCCEEKLGKTFFSSTGGQFAYHIVPTGLGLCVSIECQACNEKKDITDTSNW